MYALGIDLGTMYTAAAVWRQGRAEICSLGTRAASIPSVVWMREDEFILTGEAANRRALIDPERVAREFKRRFGDCTPVLLAGSPYSPEALTARLLAAVVAQTTHAEGGPPERVCVSHPANWGTFKTDLMRQAVRLANLAMPVSFTTEPEAAAVFYAREQRVAVGDTVAVYDLGGGTFDVAVLRRSARGFQILGQPEGIERLGGVDIDAAVFSHVVAAVRDAFSRLDEDDPAAVAAVARLRQECTDAKEALSWDTDVSIPVILPGVSTEVRLTRAELESMVRPSLYDSIEAMRRALRSANVDAGDLSAVLLVGGSSRMPLVAQLVGGELGRPVAVDTHPKHSVALGAAWLASGTPLPQEPAAQRDPVVAAQQTATPLQTASRMAEPVAADQDGDPQVSPPPVSMLAPDLPAVPRASLPAPSLPAPSLPAAASDAARLPTAAASADSSPGAADGLPGLARAASTGAAVGCAARAASTGAAVGCAAGAAGLTAAAGISTLRPKDPVGGSAAPTTTHAPATVHDAGSQPDGHSAQQAHAIPQAPGSAATTTRADFAGDDTMAHPLKFAAVPSPTRRSIGRGPIIGAAIASTVLAVGLGGWLALRAGAPPTRLMQPAAMTGPPVAATSTAGQASAGTTPRATGNGGLPAVAVVARSPQPAARLTISVHVAGTSGRVRSDDGVIDCPGRCTATYPSGRQVSLHASAAGFLGWSGCPQPDGTACTLGGDASFFPRASYRVAAATSITGTSTGTPSAPPTQSLAPALPTQSVISPTRPITSPTQSVTYGSTSTSTSPTQYPIGEVPGTGATAGANPTGTPSGGTSGVGGIG